MIRAIVVEKGQTLGEWLAQSLQDESDLAVSAAAGSLEEVLARCREHRPSVLLACESFLEAADPRRLRDQLDYGRGAAVLVLGPNDAEAHAIGWLRLGCMGYISRHDSIATLKMAIRAVAGGQMWARRTDLATLLRQLLDTRPGGRGPRLTAREEQILDLITAGACNPEIAARLFISMETVRWHARRLLVKTGARNRAALVDFARRRDFVWRRSGIPVSRAESALSVAEADSDPGSANVGIVHHF